MSERSIDWRAEAGLAGRAAAATMLAACVYSFTWLVVSDALPVSQLDVLLSVLCVAASVVLYAGAMRLSGARDPWVGGVYIAVLTVLVGVMLIVFNGVESVRPSTWMAVAACVAIIYVMDRGNPTKYAERADGSPGPRRPV
ncbi:MAG TPA: hypothetical protein VK964_19165 [Nocardioidaceae bacterium]|nr:hypothetical protein [Nocardioidaceae bacterium]